MTSKATATYDGRIVARILPPNACNAAFDLHHDIRGPRMDPTLLKAGAGYLAHRASVPITQSTDAAVGASLLGTEYSSEQNWTTLDVYVYPQSARGGMDTTGSSGESSSVVAATATHIHMQRHSSETLEKTLARMGLSLFKKLSESTKHCHKRTRAYKARNTQLSCNATIWKVDSESGVPTTPWDCQSLTNYNAWSEARYTPLAIQISLVDVELSEMDGSSSVPQTLTFAVESCPPTVTTVRTFSDWESYLYPSVPIVVQTETMYKSDQCMVDWYVNGQLLQSNSHSYTPTEADLGKSVAILVTPIRKGQHDGAGCQEAYQFSTLVQPLPENLILSLRPKWIAPRCDRSSGEASDAPLRIMTYNVLADQNAFDFGVSGKVAHSYAEYLTPQVLKRERRLPLILHEILAHQADVVCLQEVDEYVYETLFKSALRHAGYDGFFTSKENEGSREGCATFWLTTRFDPVPESNKKSHLIRDMFPFESKTDDQEWTALNDIAGLLGKRRDLRYIVAAKLGHILHLVPLQVKGDTKTIWVANTHLFYHPDASHIRLMQMYLICRELSESLKTKDGGIVLCGDMNSSLTNSPGKLLIDRIVPKNFRNLRTDLNGFRWSRQWRQPDSPNAFDDDFPSLSLPDSFPILRSALSETPAFTHFIGGLERGFRGTLDHILVSPDLIPLKSGPMPSMRDVTRDTAMPSERIPSDHVSLICEVDMTKMSSSR
jgi:exonuclease III